MKRKLLSLAVTTLLIQTPLVIAQADIVPSEEAQHRELQGVHQVLDPNSQTDDLGISVPIPISHPARRYPATDDFPTGPAVGETLLDINLPNQHGELIDLHKREGSANAVVVFFRSAMW